MRATSTAVSLTAHVVLVIAALGMTARVHSRPARPPIIIEASRFPNPVETTVTPAPGAPVIAGELSIPVIEAPVIDGVDFGRLVAPPVSGPIFAPTWAGDGQPIDVAFVDQLPAILSGPIASYPDLLRQAGIQGRVVLEAVVDTVGHVEPGSIVVVSAAHPGFVAGARQAVAATLFRPATVRGRPVRVRVRIPMEFTLRR